MIFFLEIKNDLQKIIVDAFSLFTNDNINMIPTSDLGKVIRHIGTHVRQINELQIYNP